MRVLLAYASKHGSTRGVAARMAERVADHQFSVVVSPIDRIRDPTGFDALVLGSAVHDGRWLPEAADFVRRHTVDLAARPVWLFSVSSVGDVGGFFPPTICRLLRTLRSETDEMAAFRTAIHPRDHRNFAGAIQPEDWSASGRLFLRALGGHYGDHREWDDIDRWADAICEQLPAAERTSSS